MPNCAKPAASDSLKETRDKDSSLAAALKAVVFAKPAASDCLKETRDKDSSLAAALKTAVFNPMLSKRAILCQIMQSRPLPILSKRPEIRIPARRQLSKRRFSTRFRENALFYAKLCNAGRFRFFFKETRDKDSSRAAALKTAVFNPMPSKSTILCQIMQSRPLPIL